MKRVHRTKTCEVQEYAVAQEWVKEDGASCSFDRGFCTNEAEVFVQEHSDSRGVSVCATHWESWRERSPVYAVESLQFVIEEFLWALV
jgi:hypothetical protein